MNNYLTRFSLCIGLVFSAPWHNAMACVESAPFYLSPDYSIHSSAQNQLEPAQRQSLKFNEQIVFTHNRLKSRGITDRDACLLVLTSNLLTQLDAPQAVLTDLLIGLGVTLQDFEAYVKRVHTALLDDANASIVEINPEDLVGAIVSTVFLGELLNKKSDAADQLKQINTKISTRGELNVISELAKDFSKIYELLEKSAWNEKEDAPVLSKAASSALALLVKIHHNVKPNPGFEVERLCAYKGVVPDFKLETQEGYHVAPVKPYSSPYLAQSVRVYTKLLLGTKERKVNQNLPDALGANLTFFRYDKFAHGIAGKKEINATHCSSVIKDNTVVDAVQLAERALSERRKRFLEYYSATGDRFFENTNFSFSLAAVNTFIDLEEQYNKQERSAIVSRPPISPSINEYIKEQQQFCRQSGQKKMAMLDFLERADNQIIALESYLKTAHGKARLSKYLFDFIKPGFEDVIAPDANCYFAASPANGAITNQAAYSYHIGSWESNGFFEKTQDQDNSISLAPLQKKLNNYVNQLNVRNDGFVGHLSSLKTDTNEAFHPSMSPEDKSKERARWADTVVRNVHYRAAVMGYIYQNEKEAMERRRNTYVTGVTQIDSMKMHLGNLPGLFAAQEFALIRLPLLEINAFNELEIVKSKKHLDSKDSLKFSLQYIKANPMNFAYAREILNNTQMYATSWEKIKDDIAGVYDTFSSFLRTDLGRTQVGKLAKAYKLKEDDSLSDIQKHSDLAKIAIDSCFNDPEPPACQVDVSYNYIPSLGYLRDGFSGKCRSEFLSDSLIIGRVKDINVFAHNKMMIDEYKTYFSINNRKDYVINNFLTREPNGLDKNRFDFLLFNNQTDLSKLTCSLPSSSVSNFALTLYAYMSLSKMRFYDAEYDKIKQYEPYTNDIAYQTLADLLLSFELTQRP